MKNVAQDLTPSAIGGEDLLSQSTEIGDQAAYNVVGNLSKQGAEKVEAASTRSALTVAARRMGWLTLGVAGNNNLLTDVVNDITADGARVSQKVQEGLTITASIIQELMQMIAMVVGGGFMDQVEVLEGESDSSMLQKIMNIGMLGSQSSNAALSFENGDTQEVLSKTTQWLGKEKAMFAVLQTLLDQIQQNAQQARALFTKQVSEEVQSLYKMSESLYTGDQAGIKVLLSGAG
jgi:uncharacterized protein with GYD domain